MINSPEVTLGIGTSRIASVRGGISTSKGLSLLTQASALGVSTIDTADMYGQGEAEELIGKFLRKNNREDYTIISKAGFTWSTSWKASLVKMGKPILRYALKKLPQKVDQVAQQKREGAQTSGALNQDFSPNYLQKALCNSLSRLNTDYLDAFFLHAPAEILDRDELYTFLDKIKVEGLTRKVGLCVPVHLLIHWPPSIVQRFDFIQTSLNPYTGERLRSYLQEVGLVGSVPEIVGHAIFSSMGHWNNLLHTAPLKELLAGSPEHSAPQLLMSYAYSFDHVKTLLFGTTKQSHLAKNVDVSHNLTTFSTDQQIFIENQLREYESKVATPRS